MKKLTPLFITAAHAVQSKPSSAPRMSAIGRKQCAKLRTQLGQRENLLILRMYLVASLAIFIVACGGKMDLLDTTSPDPRTHQVDSGIPSDPCANHGCTGDSGLIDTRPMADAGRTEDAPSDVLMRTDADQGTDAQPDAAIKEATLTVAFDSTPDYGIIVQTEKFWEAAQYAFAVGTDGSAPIVNSACVTQDDPDGDLADADGYLLADSIKGDSADLPSVTMKDGVACFPFTRNMLTYDVGMTTMVSLGYHAAIPLPSSAVNGAWHGAPRSGHTPRFRLVSVTTAGGQNVQVPVHQTQRTVLRKSEAVVQLRSGDPLHDGKVTLGRMTISAFPFPIALRQFMVELTADTYFATTWSTEVPPVLINGARPNTTNYPWCDLTEHVGAGTIKNLWFGACLDDDLVISWDAPVTIEFQAIVSNWKPGTTFDLHMASREQIGMQDDSVIGTWSLIDGAVGYAFSQKTTSYFIWSDLSEAPHVSKTPASTDYINMFLVPDTTTHMIWKN